MGKILFSIFYGFLWLITLLPFWVLYRISDLIFVLVFWVFRYRRKVVAQNLANAFPEKSEAERKKIEFRFFRHLCDYFFETIKMLHLSDKAIEKRVNYTNDYLIRKEKEGQNVVCMLGHTGNWEWVSSISMQIDTNWIIPYHPLRNSPYFDSFMVKLRSRFGSQLVPMKQTYRSLMEVQKSGKHFMAGMIADQSPSSTNNRHWITFLNQDTAVMEGSERIAQKTGSAVVYAKMLKIKRGYYKVTPVEITPNAKNEEDLFVTKRFFEVLEEHIREQPEYWLWSHRRWKRKRPQDEKLIKQ